MINVMVDINGKSNVIIDMAVMMMLIETIRVMIVIVVVRKY